MKKYIAECIGTFVLTFLGCGAAVSLSCGTDAASVVGTAIAFGLAVVAMAYTIGGISGCHINPAITLGCLVTGRISVKDCFGYMCGQVIGAIIAGVASTSISPEPIVFAVTSLVTTNSLVCFRPVSIITFIFYKGTSFFLKKS